MLNMKSIWERGLLEHTTEPLGCGGFSTGVCEVKIENNALITYKLFGPVQE